MNVFYIFTMSILILEAECFNDISYWGHIRHAQTLVSQAFNPVFRSLDSFKPSEALWEKVDDGGLPTLPSFEASVPERIPSPPNFPTESSVLCINQTLYVGVSVVERKTFALQMADATAKLPSGLLQGDMFWPGDYDECLAVNSDGKGDLKFHGKYCKVTLGSPSAVQPTAFSAGVCVPSGCHNEDVRGILDTVPVWLSLYLPFNLTNMTGITVSCQEPKKLDAKAVVAIVVCAITLALVAIGTVYDVYMSEWKSQVDPDKVQLVNGDAHSTSNGGAHSTSNSGPKSKMDESTPLLTDSPPEVAFSTVEKKEPGTFEKFLLAFSVYTNLGKILSTNQAKGSLTSLHGIRTFSILWVVLGHTFVFTLTTIKNFTWLKTLFQRQSFMAILNATVSVDSFFVMSGLLLTYLTLKELDKRDGKLGVKGWVMIYVHRYIRLTPVYMLLIMVWTCLLWYLGNGPLWPTVSTMDPFCLDNWWTNLLYINNLVHENHMCMAWSWYLANDMQFFILAVPVIYLMYRYRRIGLGVTLFLTLGSIMTAMIIVGVENIPIFPVTIANNAGWSMDYYFRPWTRFQTYGVGMLTGYFLYSIKCRLRIHRAVNLALWAVAALLCLLPLYGPYNVESGKSPNTLAGNIMYNGVARTSWGLGVAWVIVACVTGNGGIVNKFLSWRGFIPLGRLAYCVYLTNCMVLMYFADANRQPVTFTDLHVIMLFLGTVVLNYMAGLVASLLWEAPVMAIEKLIFKR